MAIRAVVTVAVLLAVADGSSKAGRQCRAQACDAKTGECEDRGCVMLDVANELKAAARGKIVSCSGCKLNHFDEVRRWLKDEQRWKEWQNMEMQWVNGHNPDLIVVDETGKETERVDLTQYSYAKLPEMLREKGFRMKGEY